MEELICSLDDKGLLFISAKNKRNITEFLKNGELLEPDINRKIISDKLNDNFSIYFLDDKKSILIKINNYSLDSLDLA